MWQPQRLEQPTEDPAEYDGSERLVVNLRTPRTTTERHHFSRWEAFFAVPQPIASLRVGGRVPQRVLELLAGQVDLRRLELPSANNVVSLSPLGALSRLETLQVEHTARLLDVEGIADLPHLRSLTLLSPGGGFNVSSVGRLQHLRELTFGLGGFSSRWLDVPDLKWLLPLRDLETLHLNAVRPIDSDLAPIRALPHLQRLSLPLHRAFREQAAAFAAESAPMRQLMMAFDEYDRMPR